MPPKREKRDRSLRVPMTVTERKELKALADTKGLGEAAMTRMLIKEAVQREKSPIQKDRA
jgi:hypothetical protein